MPKCTQTQSEKFNFGRIGRTPIVANFDRADLGSDGGLPMRPKLNFSDWVWVHLGIGR